MHTVYLSLGANIGNRRATLLRAVEMLGERAGMLEELSSFRETAPWGFKSPNMFINAAVCLRTRMSPLELLHVTQEIERELGRTSKTMGEMYGDRPIDIDILLYDDIRIDSPELVIPHPLMLERDFVMTPLHEILHG